MTVSKKKEILWPFLIIGVGAVICFMSVVLPLIGRPMMSEGNTYSRLQTIVMEINSPNYLTDFSWLPFYNKIMAWPLKLYFDPSGLSVRCLTLLVTLLTSGLVYILTYELTKLKSLSIVAASFFLINPLTINLSTLTLSESLWSFLVILSITFLMGKDKKYWVWGILSWMVSQGVRYESWYLTPVLIFIVWMRHKNLRLLVLVFLSSLVFPFYWMLESYKYTGVYLNIINIKKYYAANGPSNIYGNLWESAKVWFQRIDWVILWPFILVFILGIPQAVKQKNWLWLIPTISVVLLITQVFLGTMEYFPARYLVILPATIYPFVAATLKKTYVNDRVFGLVVIVLLFIFEMVSGPSRITLINEAPNKEAMAVADFVKQNYNGKPVRYISEDTKDTTWTYSTVWYFSHIPLSNFVLEQTGNYMARDNKKEGEVMTIVEKGYDKKVNDLYIDLGKKKKIIYENDYYLVWGI